ncbi:MAG: hypothetical protein WKF92_02430 [Pyrinomonadaceae bacterium]
MKNLQWKMKSMFLLLSIFHFPFSISSCSVPNLEALECTESRGVVKEFYSFHFARDMKLSPENLKLREKFLTPELIGSFENLQTEDDVFTTNSTDYPKAFRTAGCEVITPEKTVFEVVLFWRSDERSEQKEIKVETVRQNGKWLVNKVIN